MNLDNTPRQQFSPYPPGYTPHTGEASNMPQHDSKTKNLRIVFISFFLIFFMLIIICAFALCYYILHNIQDFSKQNPFEGYFSEISDAFSSTESLENYLNNLIGSDSIELDFTEEDEDYEEDYSYFDYDSLSDEQQELHDNIETYAFAIDNQVVVIAKNLNPIPVSININGVFYDEAGKKQSDTYDFCALCPANEKWAFILSSYDEEFNDTAFFDFDYEYFIDYPTEDALDYSTLIDVECKDSPSDNCFNVSYNCDTTIDASYIFVTYVFYNGGNVVSSQYYYVSPDDLPITSTVDYPIDAKGNYIEFDSYEYYVSAW